MASTATPSKKGGPKHVFKVDSPFTATTWPSIAPKDHDIILDMLCNLLMPLGRHRKLHHPPSQGKKRKRTSTTSPSAADIPPSLPLSKHLTIGLNSTTRHLESLAKLSVLSALNPPSPPQRSQAVQDALITPVPQAASTPISPAPAPQPPKLLSVIIFPHPNPHSSLLHAHIPTLIYLSSLSATPLSRTRLVLLSTASEARLASALHLPRVGALGIMEGAPGADALVSFVREVVGEVEVPWVAELLGKGEIGWLGTKVVVESKGGEGLEKEGGNVRGDTEKGKKKGNRREAGNACD